MRDYAKRSNEGAVASSVSINDGPIYAAGNVFRRVGFKGLEDCAKRFGTSLGYLLSSIFAYAIIRTMKEKGPIVSYLTYFNNICYCPPWQGR